LGAALGAATGAVAGYFDPIYNYDPDTGNYVYYAGNNTLVRGTLSVDLTPGQASALGGAATAAATAVGNGSIGEPSALVSMIPVIGNGLEVAHFFSTGQWGWATLYAAGAVLDLTGAGEAGDFALKVGLRVAEKVTAKVAARESGAYVLRFASGKMYVGKGLVSRMNQSARGLEKVYNDKVVGKIHYPSANSRAAFIMEYQLMKDTGELPTHWDKDSMLLNKIWSPGKRLSGE
jgi:hypothetical protein